MLCEIQIEHLQVQDHMTITGMYLCKSIVFIVDESNIHPSHKS
jgi:hypothetical protein